MTQIEILVLKKLEIIYYAETYGRKVTTKKFDFVTNTITYLMKMEDELIIQKIKIRELCYIKTQKQKYII